MATAAHAIDRIAEATGLLRGTVFRAARALRETDVSTWPQGSQGRGQGAHVEPRHLVNLALALAVADPITTAPEVVTFYRTLAFTGRTPLRPKHMGRAAALLTGVLGGADGLGVDLEQLIDLLAKNGAAVKVLGEIGLGVELGNDPRFPLARIISNELVDLPAESIMQREELHYAPQQKSLGISKRRDPAWPAGVEALIARTTLLPISLFVVLAELWADTLAHRARIAAKVPPLPGSAASSAPERETAASPGREAAALADQPATRKKRKRMACRNPILAAKERSLNRLPRRGLVTPIKINWSDSHAPSGKSVACGAVA